MNEFQFFGEVVVVVWGVNEFWLVIVFISGIFNFFVFVQFVVVCVCLVLDGMKLCFKEGLVRYLMIFVFDFGVFI